MIILNIICQFLKRYKYMQLIKDNSVILENSSVQQRAFMTNLYSQLYSIMVFRATNFYEEQPTQRDHVQIRRLCTNYGKENCYTLNTYVLWIYAIFSTSYQTCLKLINAVLRYILLDITLQLDTLIEAAFVADNCLKK